jgi:secreted protein with Ig-like and vWFA domain
MGFFHPGAWCWSGLTALIALLYLWNFAPRRHELATFWLWERALARRPAWFRLRFWLSLAVQLVILLLLVAALAEPYWKAAVAGRRTLVLVLDVSASMSATDVQPTRFAAAQAEARRIVQGLRPGERMGVLSVGSAVRIECRMTSRPDELRAAIDAVTPTQGGTQMGAAVDLARRLLDGQPNPQLVLLTDGCFPAAAALAAAEATSLVRFGQGGRNLAVAQLAARPDPQDPQQQQVLVAAANWSDAPATVPLDVVVDEQVAHSVALELAADAVVPTTLTLPIERSEVLAAQLRVDDDLAVDNQARLSVLGQRRPSVFYVVSSRSTAGGHAALQAALAALPGLDVQIVEQVPEPLPERSLAIFYGSVPTQLPECPLLVIAPQTACTLWELAGMLRGAEAAVAAVRQDSPLLAGVRLEDVVVEQAVKLQFSQAATALAETGAGEPLYSLVERPAGPVLVLHIALEREQSDLVLRRDFPRVIEQAVRWLSGPATTTDVATGWDAPANGPTAVPLQQATLIPREESAIRAGMSVPSREVPIPSPEREQPLWMLLTAIASVLLLAEWCFFHRKLVV